MMEFLQFAFQSFSHWLGVLVYLLAAFVAFGAGLAMVIEVLRGGK